MPVISRKTKQHTLLFLAVFLLAFLSGLLAPGSFPQRHISSLLYGALLIAWSMFVQRRILQTSVRRALTAAAGMLLALFVLRICRYGPFAWPGAVDRFLWSAYYVPFTAVPLLSLRAAVCVGRAEQDRPLRRTAWLWPVWALLCLGVLTNGAHHALFLPAEGAGGRVARYGWLYYAVAVWCAGLTLSSFIVLLRRCRLSQCRNLWYAPALAIALGVLLLAAYLAAGGSPTVWGRKLYNLQEAFAVPFVLLWECCIQIGLIPSNSDYDSIFAMSGLNAVIVDEDGRVIYRSANAEAPSPEQLAGAARAPLMLDSGHRLSRSAVPGGAVLWNDDLTNINELREELRDATERIAEENTLLELENEIKADKARFEKRNELYNQISYRTHSQLAAIDALLRSETEDEAAFQRALIRSAILCAYVKRLSSLTLSAERSDTLAAEDLRLAIRESMEYISLGGADCAVAGTAASAWPAALILLAYEVFEAVIEAALPAAGSLAVNLSAEPDFRLSIMLDRCRALPALSAFSRRLAAAGAAVTVAQEDGAVYVRLVREGGGDAA